MGGRIVYYLLGGLGIWLAVQGLLGLGWPVSIVGGVLLYQAAYKLLIDHESRDDPGPGPNDSVGPPASAGNEETR